MSLFNSTTSHSKAASLLKRPLNVIYSTAKTWLHLPLSARERNIDLPFPHEPLSTPLARYDITEAVVKFTSGAGLGLPTLIPCVYWLN